MSFKANEIYIRQDWPKVLAIIDQLLIQEPNHLVKISFQEPFR